MWYWQPNLEEKVASNLLGLKRTGAVWGFEGLEGLAKLVPLQDLVLSPAL